MKFSGLTQKGREYLAKVQANGTPIQFTKLKIGNTKLTEDENPANLIDIKNIKEEKSILEKEINGDATVLTTVIDNSSLQEGYFPRETGIYVQDEGQEVLYYYINDGDETSWIPPYSDGPHKMELKINLISSSTGSVIVNDDGSQVFVTREFVEKHYLQKGTFTGTAGDLENKIIGLAGKQNGKFPLNSAIKGNVYLLEQTQKFYICTQNYSGTTISVPNANFTELSVYENMNRLENLFNLTQDNSMHILKFSGITVIFGKFRNINLNEQSTINLNITFKSANAVAVLHHTGTTGIATVFADIEGDKLRIRVNNHNTYLSKVSGNFIIIGTV